jgi:hypothetical protein
MAGLLGCDAIDPADPQPLVVEAFFIPEQPLPSIRVTSASAVGEGTPAPVAEGISVEVKTQERTIRYRTEGGRWVPVVTERVVAGQTYAVEVTGGESSARGVARVPPRLDLGRVTLSPVDSTVRAVLLDDFRIDTTATGAREALVYPVLVRADWAAGSQPDDWVRVSVTSSRTIASRITELFFPDDLIQLESAYASGGAAVWQGGYAVPVDSTTGGRPEHRVKVTLVRAEEAYARFFASADAPERREPVGNVTGGKGLVVGVSLDSVVVTLPAFVPDAAPPPRPR